MPTETATNTFADFMLQMLDNDGRWTYEEDIPDNIMAALDRYLCDGTMPGGALTAILKNDLRDAVNRADDETLRAMPTIVSYLHSVVPAIAWGSPERVEAWPQYRATWQARHEARR